MGKTHKIQRSAQHAEITIKTKGGDLYVYKVMDYTTVNHIGFVCGIHSCNGRYCKSVKWLR